MRRYELIPRGCALQTFLLYSFRYREGFFRWLSASLRHRGQLATLRVGSGRYYTVVLRCWYQASFLRLMGGSSLKNVVQHGGLLLGARYPGRECRGSEIRYRHRLLHCRGLCPVVRIPDSALFAVSV
jgi:hypothetical protein